MRPMRSSSACIAWRSEAIIARSSKSLLGACEGPLVSAHPAANAIENAAKIAAAIRAGGMRVFWVIGLPG